VLRWLSDQRAALASRLAICESPVEVLFALALLSARDAAGPVFDLALHPPTRKPPLLAVSEAHGLRLYGQHEVATEAKRYRVDFTITGGTRKLAVEIDGHGFHASKAARSADAARDIALTKAGWTPARFTGSDIWRNADDCAARALDLLGVTVIGREALRPAAKNVEPVPVTSGRPPSAGAAGVLACLLAEGNGGAAAVPVIRRPRRSSASVGGGDAALLAELEATFGDSIPIKARSVTGERAERAVKAARDAVRRWREASPASATDWAEEARRELSAAESAVQSLSAESDGRIFVMKMGCELQEQVSIFTGGQ